MLSFRLISHNIINKGDKEITSAFLKFLSGSKGIGKTSSVSSLALSWAINGGIHANVFQ